MESLQDSYPSEEDVKRLQQRADEGDRVAMNMLGMLYKTGGNVIGSDLVQAHKLFKKAAELGDVDAMYNVGMSCRAGEGVAEDYKQAFEWFKKAAAEGTNCTKLYWSFNVNTVDDHRSSATLMTFISSSYSPF
jgi:TPR repeat protein